MAIRIERYNKDLRLQWDDFVRRSKNGTFLFYRDYMEYHGDRFQDFSLVVYDKKDKIIALLPANRSGMQLQSHAGLTYGGFVTDDQMTTTVMLSVWMTVLDYLLQSGFEDLTYKTIPYIYHKVPAEEDRYALFLAGAALRRRDALTVINNESPLKLQERRRRGIKKAEKNGLLVKSGSEFSQFWPILSATLQSRFGVAPVHTLAEIELLRDRFPANIKLFSCWQADQMLAGVVIYESGPVAHVQYIAANDEGKGVGALDLLFYNIITRFYPDKHYIDFGISNEMDGYILNTGLIQQKEGFGARAVVHDHYQVMLPSALQNLSGRVDR